MNHYQKVKGSTNLGIFWFYFLYREWELSFALSPSHPVYGHTCIQLFPFPVWLNRDFGLDQDSVF